MQCDLVSVYGEDETVRHWHILFADIIGQKLYHREHGTFPDDQLAFVLSVLKDRACDFEIISQAGGSVRRQRSEGRPVGRLIRPARDQECRSGLISTSDPLSKPIHHLFLDPSHPALAEPYPFGELAGFLQSRDVLR